jgi:nucleotide-binding universal stress UspA family protein
MNAMKLLLAAADYEDGQLAVKFVKTWFPQNGCILHVIHIVERPGALSDLSRTVFSDWEKRLMIKARRLVGRLANYFPSTKSATRPQVIRGNVKRTLLTLITDRRIHLAIVAPRVSSRARRFLLGSVSETILHNSPTSVAIARPRHVRQKCRTVLLGLDGSLSAQKAAKWLIQSRVPHCRVLLIHIEELPDTVLDRMARLDTEVAILLERSQVARQRRVRQSLKRIGDLLIAQGHGVETVISEGLPAEKILGFSERYKVDLIVLGSRGHGQFERYILGSVSSKVARHARCSVVVVK